MKDKSIKDKIQDAVDEENIYRLISSHYDSIMQFAKEINSLYKKLKMTSTTAKEMNWNGEVLKVSKSRRNKYLNKMTEAIAKRESIIAGCNHEYEQTGISYYGDCSIWTCKHCGNVIYKDEFFTDDLTKNDFVMQVSRYANDLLKEHPGGNNVLAIYTVLRDMYQIHSFDLDESFIENEPIDAIKIDNMLDIAWKEIKERYSVRDDNMIVLRKRN